MEKFSCFNQRGQRIVGIIESSTPQKGLAFVMHGLGGWKEQPHVAAAARGFLDAGCTAVRFDTTNTVGESEGSYSQATVTQYYNDLNDVIMWARGQVWYEEPFFLAGHSLGGIAVGLFAECYASLTRGLVLMGSVISGSLSCETVKYASLLDQWKRVGFIELDIRGGGKASLPWAHMVDRLQYDLLRDVHTLSMPVLQIMGGHDDMPYAHQKKLFDMIPSDHKSLEVIADAPHTFRDEKHLVLLHGYIKAWVEQQTG